MSLSSTALFHFMEKEDYLIKILKDKAFTPRYVLEGREFAIPTQYRTQKKSIVDKIAIPMTCFCDIKLTQTQDHSSRYGKYIIGMEKKWAMDSCVTPIHYLPENGDYASRYFDCIKNLYEYLSHINFNKDFKEIDDNEFNQIRNSPLIGFSTAIGLLALYQKSIYGIDLKDKKNRYFYDEKEWRYIPFHPSQPYLPVLFEEQFRNSSLLNIEQANLEKIFQLEFNIEDLKYVILPLKSELNGFINRLKYEAPALNKDLIISKIRYYDEICLDH